MNIGNILNTVNKNKVKLANYLVYICLFLFCLYPYRDYDWGWHYKYGEYFFTHGFPYISDTYSWTLSGYQWINHSWMYDPLMYIIFSTTSFLGLSLAGAIVSVCAFYFCVKGINLRPYQLALSAFLFGYLTSGVIWQGLRSQVVGLLLIAINGYLLREVNKGSKRAHILLVVLYLVWANLHGSITYGIALFTFFVIQKICIDSKRDGKTYIGKKEVYLLGTYALSILVTLINPFGIKIYIEALRHFSNPLLKYILEWNPVQFPSTFFLMMALYVGVLIMAIYLDFRKRKKINLFMILTIVASSYLLFNSRRYVAVALVGTLPFFALLLQDFKYNIEKYKSTHLIFIVCIIVALEISIFNRIIPWKIFQGYSYKEFCDMGSKCSEELTAYLIKNPPKGKGFNFYDWGGYLIGRGIPAKLFIDGRMHLWKDKKTGYEPFADYQKMYYENDMERFVKYDIDWVLIPTNATINMHIQSKKVGEWDKKFDDGRAVYWVRKK